MSSSKSHKSRSGSVHDSDSESSIEYVQTQSPLSPNIPLTTPITSSMNVSGLNIDVGNPKAPTSSTWSIQFPQIQLIHKSMCLRGQKAHLKYHQMLFPNQNFHPTLNIPSGSQVHVGDERRLEWGQRKRPLENVNWSGLSEGNPGLTFHQNMAPKGKSVQSQEPIEDCDELYASSPLVHKEKVTGHHHPYASKPRTPHASSSREKMMDDEDENMSPAQMETNDESRRDNFTAHEHGTQSNSEFTHPQMPLAQSMLEQSKVRQQRNQDRKAHNVAKRENQKEQQKWLKAELPENVRGMISEVHTHFLFLLKDRDKNFSSLPAPPSTEEREIAIQVAGHLGYVPEDVFNEPSTQVQSQGFQSYCKNELHKLGLK
ncbi:hypothetical protein O181_100683 [Austropuccinia psidii MF-1]|uniref:Uncharacterized protein n=1 Tax=Austropuccinia psidii MF-1 TaxID=1389203 RepID=A0A9Q3JF29_9BASI|nr:hypothetical protein [Austropuccinia psidii MF-1]